MMPFLAAHPRALPAAILAGIGLAARRSSVVLPREGFWIEAGTKRGQGLWCALAGMAYEPELPWLVQWLQKGDSFVDVGANVGIYSLHAARKVAPAGRVISMEPGPAAFRILSKNLARNRMGCAQAIQAAASNQEGTMQISGSPDLWNSLTLRPGKVEGVQVPVRTVDNLCEELGVRNVSALKIDAEGFECEVLEGAMNTLSNCRPAVIFETIFESDRQSPKQLLGSLGYQFFVLNSAGGVPSPNSVGIHPDHPRAHAFL